jgi:hypothetical protein
LAVWNCKVEIARGRDRSGDPGIAGFSTPSRGRRAVVVAAGGGGAEGPYRRATLRATDDIQTTAMDLRALWTLLTRLDSQTTPTLKQRAMKILEEVVASADPRVDAMFGPGCSWTPLLAAKMAVEHEAGGIATLVLAAYFKDVNPVLSRGLVKQCDEAEEAHAAEAARKLEATTADLAEADRALEEALRNVARTEVAAESWRRAGRGRPSRRRQTALRPEEQGQSRARAVEESRASLCWCRGVDPYEVTDGRGLCTLCGKRVVVATLGDYKLGVSCGCAEPCADEMYFCLKCKSAILQPDGKFHRYNLTAVTRAVYVNYKLAKATEL